MHYTVLNNTRYRDEGEAEEERRKKNKMERESQEKRRKGYRESKRQCASSSHFLFCLPFLQFRFSHKARACLTVM